MITETHPDRVYSMLFVCTGNSARSILAECLADRIGEGLFKGYSAGSDPAGRVHPLALELLERRGHPTGHLRSKHWSEFTAEGAPQLDFVITVCDRAAGEVCPVWPGRPVSAHWGFPDPAAVHGSEAQMRAAFADAYREIATRIGVFANLPLATLDRLSLEKRVRELGRSPRLIA